MNEISKTKPESELARKENGSLEKSASAPAIAKLKFFVTIVTHSYQKDVLKILKNYEVGISFITHGYGTGTREIYAILGLSDVRKDLVFAVIKSENAEKIKAEIEKMFKQSRDAKGIAFAIDISSVIGLSIYKYLTNTRN
ncbi:MAG: hypothetical protein WC282_04225 [Bacilli bacterium]|jgi:hypothetical protein